MAVQSDTRVPVLQTRRLILRPHRLDDFKACASMWSDPRVTRFIGGVPSTETQTWARILSYLGHWRLLGFGYWAVEEKATSRFIGELGFADFKRDIDIRFRDLPEIGWAFATPFHGRGLASEAVQAVTAWGKENFNADRTFCIIDPQNLASIRIAEKFGYLESCRLDFKGNQKIFFIRSAVAI